VKKFSKKKTLDIPIGNSLPSSVNRLLSFVGFPFPLEGSAVSIPNESHRDAPPQDFLVATDERAVQAPHMLNKEFGDPEYPPRSSKPPRF
jgi:hypothetical protein